MNIFLYFSDDILLNHSFHGFLCQRKSGNIPAKGMSLGPWDIGVTGDTCNHFKRQKFSLGNVILAKVHFCVLNKFWKHLEILLNLLYIIFSSQNVVVHALAPVQPQFSLLPTCSPSCSHPSYRLLCTEAILTPPTSWPRTPPDPRLPSELVHAQSLWLLFSLQTFPLFLPTLPQETWLFSPLHFQYTIYIAQTKYFLYPSQYNYPL